MGHWALGCPNPHRNPRGPCPRCHREGHWSVDCPCAHGGMGSSDPETSPGQTLTLIFPHSSPGPFFPQGFRDSPHLFGQALASDLLLLSLPKSKLIQHVDDILLCSPSLEISKTDTVALLNFLSKRGYRVSPSKVQLSTTQFLPPKKKFYRSWEWPASCVPGSPPFLSSPAPYMKQLSALCMSPFSIRLPNPSKDSNGPFSRLQLFIFRI